MVSSLKPPNGWRRESATHRDRKYTSEAPVVYEHETTGRQIEVVPMLASAPGDDVEWQIREITDEQQLLLDSADDRQNALAVAKEAMQGH